jgi:hypothetical protein
MVLYSFLSQTGKRNETKATRAFKCYFDSEIEVTKLKV